MIAIIKYNAGNYSSVQNAIARLGYKSIITANEDEILRADKVIFPGVGEASSAMRYLVEKGLDQTILKLVKPTLGICLGQQLMCASSEEGNTSCLGIFDAKVKKFPNMDVVPHMGWNSFTEVKGTLFKNVKKTDDVYFVHSYYVEVCDETSAICDYIKPFSAAMQKGNFYATQFHPEKSADIGEKILKNFLEL
jgi:glutamine amidotransferase